MWVTRAGCALGAATTLAVLGGCGAGFDAGTRQFDPEYTAADVGALRIRALVLVKSADDRAVGVVVTFVNDGTTDDVLSKVAVAADESLNATSMLPDGAPESVDLVAEPRLRIPAGGVVAVGGPGEPRIDMADPQRRIRRGEFVSMILSFARAGRTEVDVLVEDPSGYLAPYAPPSVPTGPPGG